MRTVKCQECGDVFEYPVTRGRPRKTCDECKSAVREPKPRITDATCPVCSSAFTAKMSHGVRQVTCSRACGLAMKRSRFAETSCFVCEIVFTPTVMDQAYCSASCRQKVNASRVYFGSCVICSSPFVGRAASRLVCYNDTCNAERIRRHMRENYARFKPDAIKNAHIRRARIKLNGYEIVDPIKVYERDGWTCQLCGEPVKRETTIKRDPHMASLDHIIPIVHGGSHTYNNVQCSHYVCNLRKHDRVEKVQL